jgi:hypothetical protein
LLGLEIIPNKKVIRFNKPYLPSFLSWIKLSGIQVDSLRINLEILRHKSNEHVSIHWSNQPKDWKMEVSME